MTPPSRAELIHHLVRTGIAGHVDTPRQGNLRHYQRLCDQNPYYELGLTFSHEWTFPEVLALMAKRCGVMPDENHLWGVDTIDPERTADALESTADRMAEAAHRNERVMLATGHPGNLHETLAEWGSVLRAHGCPLVTAAGGYSYEIRTEHPPYRRTLAWPDSVGVVVDDDGDPRHSHHPFAMEAALEELTSRGHPWPHLVIADHGFAGGAGQAGVDTIGFADCNDPALFLGEHEGKLHTAVPLDDGFHTGIYQPLSAYVLHRAGLAGGTAPQHL